MPTYMQLRVALQEVQPAPWRRFLIREGASFGDLHDAIQVACGWGNRHLFSFYPECLEDDAIAGVPDEDDLLTPDAQRVLLSTHFGSHSRCVYLYDFGDGWEHEVRLEDRQELPEVLERRLLGGELAFPPEDCGGISGYEECRAVIRERKPTTAEQRELLRWLGAWEPERFELEQVARKFDRPKALGTRKPTGA